MVNLSSNNSNNVRISAGGQRNINVNSPTDNNINANNNGNSQRARSWAIGEGLIDGEDYSAKYWAEQAKISEEIARESIDAENNAHIWAEGTDEEVEAIGGTHSSKGWVDYVIENAPTASVEETEQGAVLTVTDINGTTTATIYNGADGQDGQDGAPGQDGRDGADGADGQDGQDGFSPIATVSKSGSTATISITDANGTTTTTITDGTNGTNGTDGQDGEDGFSPTATVTKSGSVATITITDKNGTTTANVYDGTGGGGSWGSITGDISDQTDLQDALDDKQDKLTAGTDLEILNGSPLHNLPSGYTELEYVQSSGTQYLDTGVAFKDGIRVEVDFQYISLRGTAYTFGFNDYLGYLFYVSNGVYTINSSQSINYSASIYNKNHISAIFNLTNNIPTITATIGNETKTFARSNSGGSPSNLQIFTASGQTSNASTGRCYGVKVYDNDVLVMELVPAIRTSDNKVGMYDTVGNTFKINSGTGNLIASAPAVEQTIINFTNDTGYITGINSTDVTTALGYTPVNPSSLATVATSGDYDDLTNKPTIPTVGDGTITINQGGVQKGTFTTNQSGNTTIDLDAGGGGGIQNTATGTDSLTILGTASTYNSAINIGVGSSVSGIQSVAVGKNSVAGKLAVALGYNAEAANGSIQLGYGTNSNTNTFSVGFYNGGNYELLDNSGIIPDARLSSNIARASQIPTLTSDLTNDSGYIAGITGLDVTTALGYTPYNSTNPDGYITGISSSDVTTALGYTPLNTNASNLSSTGKKVFDGQWVGTDKTLLDSVTFAANTATDYSLSTYLPDDNYQYEVLMSIVGRTGTTSGNAGQFYVGSQLLGTTLCLATVRAQGSSYNYFGGAMVVPIGTNRVLTLQNVAIVATTNTTVRLGAYRRIGTNS